MCGSLFLALVRWRSSCSNRSTTVATALEEAKGLGFVPIDSTPHRGSRGTVVGLVDPLRADGVLIQYVQEP